MILATGSSGNLFVCGNGSKTVLNLLCRLSCCCRVFSGGGSPVHLCMYANVSGGTCSTSGGGCLLSRFNDMFLTDAFITFMLCVITSDAIHYKEWEPQNKGCVLKCD